MKKDEGPWAHGPLIKLSEQGVRSREGGRGWQKRRRAGGMEGGSEGQRVMAQLREHL